MKAISFKCEIITPMFMAGADGKTPELRPPSIKGMMRFWWRAINGHLSLKELREKEGEFFGTSDEGVGRSKFSLIVSDLRSNETPISLMPHHTKGYCSSANTACYGFDFKQGLCKKGNLLKGILGSFSTRFVISNKMSLDVIKNLFIITTILGGLGKRSRRGFGSVRIVQIDDKTAPQYNSINDLYNLLDLIKPSAFVLNKTKIEIISSAVLERAKYPYIKEIEIGKTSKHDELLKKIGEASHTHDCYHTGFAEKPYRFASPIYVSVIKNDTGEFLPIVTTLNCAFEIGLNKLKNEQKKTDKSLDFKKAILS